jgi:hypothetical protein
MFRLLDVKSMGCSSLGALTFDIQQSKVNWTAFHHPAIQISSVDIPKYWTLHWSRAATQRGAMAQQHHFTLDIKVPFYNFRPINQCK